MNDYKILDINPNTIVIDKDGEETRYFFKNFDVAKNEVMIYKDGQGVPLRMFLEPGRTGIPSRFDSKKMRDILTNYTFAPDGANSSYFSGGGHRRSSRKNIKKSAKRRVRYTKRATKSRKYRRQRK